MAFTDYIPPDNALGNGRLLPGDDTFGIPVPAEPQPEDHHQKLLRWSDPRKTSNIAKELTEDELGKIGQTVQREYQIDVDSRSDWLECTEKAMKLAMQVTEEKSYPWPRASNVIFPLMTTSAIQFAARAYPAIVAGRNVVRGVVYGDDNGTPEMGPDGQPVIMQTPQGPQPKWKVPPGAKQARADRIGHHMSYQLLEEQPEWEDETDKLLHIVPIVGCSFRKSYFDPGQGRNMSLLVRAECLVINYWAKSMELAPRITEELKLYPIEIEEHIRAGIFIDQDYLASNTTNSSDDDAPREFLEQHRWSDLDEDGYPEPYIVTIRKDTNKVARIVARYDAEGVHVKSDRKTVAKIDPVHYYTKYDFLPNIEGGIYGMGFGRLLGPINESVNSTLNMLLDAGHQQVAGGGFIGRGLSMHGGSVRFKLGEYKVVNTPGANIRDAIVPMQFAGPNAILFQLLGMLVEAGREVASVKDVLTGDQQQANVPATTTLALIEQGLKVFTGIYKRIHRAARTEYDKLYRLNRIYLNEQASYKIGDEWHQITRQDYEIGSSVQPISDPVMVSDMQRLGRAQYIGQFMNDPLFNPIETRRRMLEAANITDIDKLLNTQPPPPPPDPAVEIANGQLQVERGKLQQSGMVKAEELKQSAHKVAAEINAKRAEEVRNLSQALKNMAEVDAIVSEDQRSWVGQQMSIIQQWTDMAQSGNGEASAPATPAPTPAPAPQPAPPMQGARKAPDGHYYIPNPQRQGKYMQLLMSDGAAPAQAVQ